MKQEVTFFVFNAVILIGLVSGINESGRKTKIPYEPGDFRDQSYKTYKRLTPLT